MEEVAGLDATNAPHSSNIKSKLDAIGCSVEFSLVFRGCAGTIVFVEAFFSSDCFIGTIDC